MPFKSKKIVELVAKPDVWIARVESRGSQHDRNDKMARLNEAKSNLLWALGRDDILWIDNSCEKSKTVDMVNEIIHGKNDINTRRARKIGEKLLKYIEDNF